MTAYIERDLKESRASFVITDRRQLSSTGVDFINSNAFASCERCSLRGGGENFGPACGVNGGCGGSVLTEPVRVINRVWDNWQELEEADPLCTFGKKRVNILALGDVGGTMLLGLRLLGGEAISSIGICDVNEKNVTRWEFEANQIYRAFNPGAMPEVKPVAIKQLFDCDVFIFTASGGIPAVGSDIKDVRMAQLEVNKKIVGIYARQARDAGFKGLFCVVSDPVDNLCGHVYHESNKNERGEYDFKGLRAEQVQGFGLGVMNARAMYYASKDDKFSHYEIEGRAFGPHGKDLVIADSILHYNDELSRELTARVVNANMELRGVGFKPYIAPALSSAALSIIETIKGNWHYGSVYLGGVYMGVKNRYTPLGQETELIPMAPELYERILTAAEGLK